MRIEKLRLPAVLLCAAQLIAGIPPSVRAEAPPPPVGDSLLIPHVDELEYDPALTLGEVVQTTVTHFPRTHLARAFDEEARAWDRRANGWLAGPTLFGVTYSGDQVGDDSGQWSLDTDLTFMIWKWGQRAAAEEVAGEAARYARHYRKALHLQVAGSVREALWDLELKRVTYETADQVLAVSEKLTEAVRKRVDAGDLPRTDLLLAKTDFLQHRSRAMSAEAEWMHARRRYLNLTRIDRAPADFEEALSAKQSISVEHPLLAAASARIEEEKARLRFTRFESDTGNQQIYFSVGSRHEHTTRGGPSLNGIAANLTVPFGGGTYQAPNVAAVRTALAEAETRRGELYRKLERDLHEAEHILQVDRVQLEQAKTRRQLAESNLDLSRKAFEAGEMNLIDLLKVQVFAQEALRDAQRWRVQVQRDIARYNQAVGELP
ncbi:MAG: TolC family protein [Methylohalobius sp. ZOD2]